MANWFDRVVLGRKAKKPKAKLKLDKWFVILMAVLLWSLGTILFRDYAFQIPYFLADVSFWLRMVAVVFAIFLWMWLWRIYISEVRGRQEIIRNIGERLEVIEGKAEQGDRLSALESAIEQLKQGEMPKIEKPKKDFE